MHIMVLNEKIYELPVFLVMIALVAEAWFFNEAGVTIQQYFLGTDFNRSGI
jgi:hypothetical protein